MLSDPTKAFYRTYHDRIADKRFDSPFWIRRYAHRAIYAKTLRHVEPGQRVLDAGCGEGVLSALMGERGADVVGVDMSDANVQAARERYAGAGTRPPSLVFVVGDLERLPFPDNAFDLVVASHVIEHLPDPVTGLQELRRVTRSRALVAMPTCLNPAAWALLGGDGYWSLSKRSLIAVPLGLMRTVKALFQGREGPDEGYAGQEEIPHVWRFPWAFVGLLRQAGFEVEQIEAGPLLVPYVAEYWEVTRRLQQKLDRWSQRPVIRHLGYGTHAMVRKA